MKKINISFLFNSVVIDCDCFVSNDIVPEYDIGGIRNEHESDLEEEVTNKIEGFWGSLRQTQRKFILLYSRKIAFVEAHGGIDEKKNWVIRDGRRTYNLRHFIANREKEYDCFFLVVCNPWGIQLEPLERALMVLSSLPTVNTGGAFVSENIWSITHPVYGDMDYITEWAIEQIKIKKKRSEKNESG